MKMRKYCGSISTRKVGSRTYFEFEMPEDSTRDEIEAEALAAALDCVDWTYDEVDELDG